MTKPKILFLVLFSLLGSVLAQAQKSSKAKESAPPGYKIEVNLEGFQQNQLYLAYYFQDKQYIRDTAEVKDGKAVFTNSEPLEQGTYLLVLPPDNDFAQLFIGDDQHFKLSSRADKLSSAMKVEGSTENAALYGYIQFLEQVRGEADSLRKRSTDSTLSAELRAEASTKVEAIDAKVKARQEKLKAELPGSQLAALLKSMDETPMPAFTGTEEEQQRQRYYFYKKHYFDHVDLGDPRLLRSSFLDQRVNYYLEKLVIPAPDTIIRDLDYLLEKMRPAPETFKAYLVKFLNKYASSKIVGQDAVYAHLGRKYYASGQASWVDSATLAKIIENVDRLEPLLIGKPAPQIETQKEDGTKVSLYGIEAEYTVLFFFDPECGVCKKQTPDLIAFAKTYADKGVKVMSVCSKFAPDVQPCWDYVKDKEGMSDFLINTVDPYHRSRYKTLYDVQSTPMIYVLDRGKRIVSKRVAAEQLPEVIDNLIEFEKNQEAEKASQR